MDERLGTAAPPLQRLPELGDRLDYAIVDGLVQLPSGSLEAPGPGAALRTTAVGFTGTSSACRLDLPNRDAERGGHVVAVLDHIEAALLAGGHAADVLL
jgi:hypothetical protein